MSNEINQEVQWVSPDTYQGMLPPTNFGTAVHSRAISPAFDGEDFPLGPACDLSGEGSCEVCQ